MADRRLVAVGLLALSLLLAGCSSLSPSPGTAEPATVESVTPTASTTETTSTISLTATETPAKGTQFLSTVEVNRSQAMRFDASERTTFENLSTEREQVVEKSIECDCAVTLHGEFSFYDQERVRVVKYEGRYYSLVVAIV